MQLPYNLLPYNLVSLINSLLHSQVRQPFKSVMVVHQGAGKHDTESDLHRLPSDACINFWKNICAEKLICLWIEIMLITFFLLK